MRWPLSALGLLLAVGCADKDDVATDDTGASGEGGGEGGGEGVGEGGGEGGGGDEAWTLVYAGAATATASSYAGTEDVVAYEDATGDELCRVRVSLASTGTRDDCEGCAWAYDLVASDPQRVAESGAGCEGTLGLDDAAIAAMGGVARAYGVNPDYFGHAAVLFVYGELGWNVATFIEWDEESGAFSYEWEEVEESK